MTAARLAPAPTDHHGRPPPLAARGLAWGHSARALLGRELDLSLEPGEALSVVGPNGAGKSTLLLTLSGRLPPLEGQVVLAGANARRLGAAERARRVAVLPQAAETDPELTVRELVELGRTAYLGLWGRLGPRDRDAIDRALAACDLEFLAAHRLGRLSGGERQRALIAMAVAQEAPLLVLDEPTTHLDLRRRAELFALLSDLRARSGLAVLMALHELSDAFSQASRLLVLSGEGAEELDRADPQVRAKLARAFGIEEKVLSHLRLEEMTD